MKFSQEVAGLLWDRDRFILSPGGFCSVAVLEEMNEFAARFSLLNKVYQSTEFFSCRLNNKPTSEKPKKSS